jgi:hypothetical protein
MPVTDKLFTFCDNHAAMLSSCAALLLCVFIIVGNSYGNAIRLNYICATTSGNPAHALVHHSCSQTELRGIIFKRYGH